MTSQRLRDINGYSGQLDNSNGQITRAIAKAFSINLTQKFQKCDNYTLGKTHKKNRNEATNKKAEIPGGHLCLDISSPENQGVRGKHNLILFLDEH